MRVQFECVPRPEVLLRPQYPRHSLGAEHRVPVGQVKVEVRRRGLARIAELRDRLSPSHAFAGIAGQPHAFRKRRGKHRGL